MSSPPWQNKTEAASRSAVRERSVGWNPSEIQHKRLPYETGSRTVSHLEGLAPSFTLGAGTKNLCVELSTESHILKTTEGFQSKAPHVFITKPLPANGRVNNGACYFLVCRMKGHAYTTAAPLCGLSQFQIKQRWNMVTRNIGIRSKKCRLHE